MINLGRCRLFADDDPEISTRAVDLVAHSTVVDMLGLLTLDWAKLLHWQRSPYSFGEDDFRQLESSGINVFHPAVETHSADPAGAARRWLAGWNARLSHEPCFLGRIDSSGQLESYARQGRIGLLLGFQNSNHFRTAADVELFHSLGQRVSQLTYNRTNRLGGGCLARRVSGPGIRSARPPSRPDGGAT